MSVLPLLAPPLGALEVAFDAYLPRETDDGRPVAYTNGPGKIRMHPENLGRLDDLVVKVGPDLRAPPPVWAVQPPPVGLEFRFRLFAYEP